TRCIRCAGYRPTRRSSELRTVAGNRTAWHGPGTVDRMLTALHTAIVTGSPPEVGPGDALAALRVTDAAARSLALGLPVDARAHRDRKSTRLNSSHVKSSYA